MRMHACKLLLALQNNVQALDPAFLDSFQAQLWMLAPPCQPYTRQGLRKGAADGRAGSFLTLLRKCAFIPTRVRMRAVRKLACVLPFSTL